MAFFEELSPFVLTDVQGLEKQIEIGRGPYQIIYKVSVNSVPCVARRLHGVLVEEATPQDLDEMLKQFSNQCILHSTLTHPNIANFVGIYYENNPIPYLLVEYFPSSLALFLDSQAVVTLPDKLSILRDVVNALTYLHSLDPQIIHCDLAVHHVLLTTSLQAKVAGFFESQQFSSHYLANSSHHQIERPGTEAYMPPEALQSDPRYTTKLDIFSFGILAIHVANQKFPDFTEPLELEEGSRAISRRRKPLEQMGNDHCLYPMTLQCLQDDPECRPTAKQLSQMFVQLCEVHPKGRTGESRHRLKTAMEKGHIKTCISTVLVHGPAGSGKTCSKCLIVGEDPPKVRQSTPVVARPARIYRFDVSFDEWKGLSPQQRKYILAQAAKSQAIEPDSQEDKEPLLTSGGTNVEITKSSVIHMGRPTSSDHQQSDSKKDPHAEHPTIPHLTTDEELVDLIEKCSADKPILQLHMMHIIDTGGQPQCHDLMRYFVKRRTSLYIFVFKLSDKFDAKPLIAYYDESGRLISADFRATQTNEQILQQCVRTMQSQKSKMLFLGTHMDQESQCSENRETKNEKLLKMALPHFRNEVVYYKLTGKELIFPINACHPGQHEKDIAESVRKLICTRCSSEEFDLPMQWYGLEIILEELSERLDRKVMHRSECLAASKKLHFHELDFDAAIDYLDEHCLILYYRDILPDVIFSDIQVLLDKVTELVHASFEVKTQTPTTQCIREGFWQNFGDLARVSHAFLSQECFKKHYVAGLFTPTELIELFRKLSIFADFDEDEYFMPALLGSLSCDELQSHRVSPSAALSSFVLLFPNGPQLGVFCCLIVFLLSAENIFPASWKLQCNSDHITPKCLQRNCVTFRIPGYSGSITLIDSFHHFEMHFTFPPRVTAKPSLCTKISFFICQAVLHGLSVANEKLGYVNVLPKPCFACPCEKREFHYAEAGNEDTCLICSEDEDECNDLKPSQRVWLKSFSQASQGLAAVPLVKSAQVEALAALLQPIAGSWSLFLGQLGVEKARQDEIAVNNSNMPNYAQLCLRDGLDLWVKTDHSPTYERIAAVLRGKTVPDRELAEEVQKFAIASA